MNIELPANIKQLLQGYSVEEGPRGLSGAGIYKFRSDKSTYFLKVLAATYHFINELEDEYAILKWLDGKFAAPKVIAFEKTRENSYLLMTEAEGETLEDFYSSNATVKETVRIYAEGLKHLHSLDINGCPKENSVEAILMDIRKNLEHGMDLENMEHEYKGLSPLQLYDRLLSLKPKYNECVFTHGDYCFDNIMVKNDKLSGIIDVGRSGIGDRYRDIALAVRNIRGDFGEHWLDLFFKEYGISEPDWDKIEFYIIVDEFY